VSAAVALLVVVGVAMVVGVSLNAGVDLFGALIMASILALGALGVAVARRARGGAVGPRRCPECGGVVSPQAPYCKHCGALFAAE
jgi:hypothetical protein